MSEVGMVVILLHVISTWAHDQCTEDSLASVHVNCSRQVLQKVPDGLPNTTETLILDHNNISLMGKEFRGFHQMNELSLVGNGIHNIPRTIFSGLGQLEKLHLSINKLNYLHYNVFSELFNLQEIYLDHNALHCIHDRLFANLSRVKIIDISHNLIQILNGSILFHTLTDSLLTLNASHNRLSFLTMPIFKSNFKSIDVSHNVLQYLCNFHSYDLEVADFSNNNISKVFFIYFSSALKVMNLSHNILSSVGFEMSDFDDYFIVDDLIISEGHMTKVNIVLFSVTLHKLDLSGNNITYIYRHPEHSQLPFVVQNVSLARNPSIYVPDDVIKRFAEMTQFDLSGNTIDLNNLTLISEIFMLPKLILFRVVDCTICELMPPHVLARYFNCSEKVAVVCADTEGMTGRTLSSIRSDVELPNTSSVNNTDVCPDQIVVPEQLLCPGLCFCNTVNSETVLDCTDLNIDEIMPFYTNYTVIKLEYNCIKYLSATSFSSQMNLLSLNISHNSIQTIPVDAFQHLTSLEFLDLSYNPLSYLPENVFKNLISLEYLSLEGNNLTVVSENIFKNLLNLKYLNLGFGIQLKKIHAGTFKTLTKIENLQITNAGLHLLPPGAFDNLTNLRTLHLDNNQLNVIENDIFFNLHKLSDLDLSNNNIVTLGNDLLKKSTVTNLYLNNNKLTRIKLNYLMRLTECVVSHNFLKNINFTDTPRITVLQLNNNDLSDLDSTTFKGINNLRVLNLSNNPLKNIPSDLFYYVNKLLYLDLANTSLHSLPVNVFSSLILLRDLNLGQNYPQYLTCAHFVNLGNLYRLSFIVDHHNNSAEEVTVNYRNITLIDCLYSKRSLEIILTGHAICQQLEREQIIQKLFLSYYTKGDACV